jgi:RNA polymerase sigma-70 factor, ECF subfamily
MSNRPPLTDDDSRQLLGRASQGDGVAIDQLLQEHLPGLRAYIRLKAGAVLLARESSTDLAQSVCRDILENAGRYQYSADGGFRRWLFTTALRKIADRYEFYGAQKRAQAQEQSLGDDEGLLAACRGFYTPSRQAAAREDLARLEQAFSRLDDDKREVVLQSRILGMSHAEIAAQMGRTEVAVRKLLSRALAELAEIMEG